MNQLADIVKRMNAADRNFESGSVYPQEISIITSISGLLELSAMELDARIQQKDGPTDWLILPPLSIYIKETH